MKRIVLSICCTALCLCFTASLCCGCAVPFPDLAMSVAAEAPSAPLIEHIREALSREEETIDLTAYRIDEEALHRTYSYLYATDPSLFYLSAEYSIAKHPDGSVHYLRPAYRMTGEARIRAVEDFSRRIATIVAPVRTLAPLEQIAYLHDYMVMHFTYDIDHAVHDAYSLLTGGRGVCQAYALLFTALARELGVESACVTCFDRSHEWNAVRLDGVWYHIDLVWDDTDLSGEVLHTFFLVGDEELRALRILRDTAWDTTYTWSAPASSGGEKVLNAPWRSLTVPFRLAADNGLLFSADGICYHIGADLSCTPQTNKKEP